MHPGIEDLENGVSGFQQVLPPFEVPEFVGENRQPIMAVQKKQ